MALTPSTMLPGQYIVVRLTADMRNYTAFVVDPSADVTFDAAGIPAEPVQAVSNRTTSASTLATNIQNALPTLSS